MNKKTQEGGLKFKFLHYIPIDKTSNKIEVRDLFVDCVIKIQSIFIN